MTDRDGGRTTPVPRVVQARLQSWKDIANYLQRDERTVRRWEKMEGLPVHRLQHGKLGSVFANPAELDEWVSLRTDTFPRRLREKRSVRRWVGEHAAMLFLFAGCLTFIAVIWVAVKSGTHEQKKLTAIPLTSHPGTELEPSLSPDGKHFAYAWDGEDQRNFDIYVGLVTGGSSLRLTTHAANDYSPAWSPDGTAIAFMRTTGATSAAVLTVSALGGAERLVTHVSTARWPQWNRPGPFLTWSRNGKQLVVVGRYETNATDRLLAVALETGDVTPLTSPPAAAMGDTAPAISPDGTMLAFSRRESWGVSRLCVAPLNQDGFRTTEVKILDTGSTWNASPAWTPDARALIFSTGRMDGPHLTRIGIAGNGRLESLAGIGPYGWHPSVARTREGQTRLVFTRHFESVNLWRQPVDSPRASELVKSAHWTYEPDLSVDGSRIAFLSDRSGFAEVWVARADGGEPRQWTFLKHPNLGAPRWSRDGRSIAFTAPGADGSSINLIDRPGGSPREIPGSHRCGYIAWSADGKALYFSTNRRNGTQIWKIGVEGGDAVQVTTTGGRVPAVSPDGHFLYYLRMVNSAGDNHLFRMPLPQGDEEKVLECVDAYSISEAGIGFRYYRGGMEPDGPYHRFLRFSTGVIEDLPRPNKRLRYGIALSSDGQHLIYAQSDYEVSDLVLVDGID